VLGLGSRGVEVRCAAMLAVEGQGQSQGLDCDSDCDCSFLPLVYSMGMR
jgi:hypothetical protein